MSIINDRAFQYCTSLHSVTFEDGGSRDSLYIGHYAFDSCSFLNTVNWGTDWTDINVTVGEGIFNGCTSLSNLYIPNQNQGE